MFRAGGNFGVLRRDEHEASASWTIVGIKQREMGEFVDEVALAVHDDERRWVFGLQIVEDQILQQRRLARAASRPAHAYG